MVYFNREAERWMRLGSKRAGTLPDEAYDHMSREGSTVSEVHRATIIADGGNVTITAHIAPDGHGVVRCELGTLAGNVALLMSPNQALEVATELINSFTKITNNNKPR
jgi:hypothetical protein